MKDESNTGEFVLEVFETYGDAYYRGRVAADLGRSGETCPFDHSDPQYEAWQCGWLRQCKLWLELRATVKSL
jgi:ribosome modulation factor